MGAFQKLLVVVACTKPRERGKLRLPRAYVAFVQRMLAGARATIKWFTAGPPSRRTPHGRGWVLLVEACTLHGRDKAGLTNGVGSTAERPSFIRAVGAERIQPLESAMTDRAPKHAVAFLDELLLHFFARIRELGVQNEADVRIVA